MTISFTIPGRISGKGRPKFNGSIITRAYESALKDLLERAACLAATKVNQSPEEIAAAIRAMPLHDPNKDFKGGFVQVYTPPETIKMEAYVGTFAKAAMQGRPPLTGPVWVSIVAVLNPPASWSKKNRAEAFWVTGKPDNDNVEKLIGDALNGICWEDDSKISLNFFARRYDLSMEESVTISFGELTGQAIPFQRPDFVPDELPLLAGLT